MPIFTFIQVIASRIIIGVVAILTAFGLGVVTDSPTDIVVVDKPIQKIEEVLSQEPQSLEKEDLEIESTDPESSNSETEAVVPIDIEEEKPEENVVLTPPPVEEDNIVVNTPVTEIESPLSFSQINTETAEALVNIMCSQKVFGAVSPITGSGVIIDPRGIVITNAHVAQFFLLKDHPVENSLECVLRTGSPARNKYTAELLYISPEWVGLHASDIRKTEPKGTGEYDYAFLRITGLTDPNGELSTTFPFVSIDVNSVDIKTGDQVLAAAYPAGFLGGISIQKVLYSVSSIATVGERFTFLEKTVDLFSIGGTVVSQGGSSGGAVVSDENNLVGIIVTSTQADSTAERDLRAITINYINRDLTQNADTTIEGLLFGDVILKAKLFNVNVVPNLTGQFLDYLIR